MSGAAKGLPAYLDLPALASASGVVRLPGSKSISNRTLLLAAIASGDTEVHGLLASDDTGHMLEALHRLGVRVDRQDGGTCVVHGAAGPPPGKEADLFLGNAGTAFRPLTAVLAFSGGHYRLSGVPRMHERPIRDLVDALRPLGADIRYAGDEGFPPLVIAPMRPAESNADRDVHVRGDVSSQFLTALLIALPLARDARAIVVEGDLISKPYVEITLNLMERFGVCVKRHGWSRFEIPVGAAYRSPDVIHVEGDASSASYFLAAGAIAGGPVRVEGVGRRSIQGDVRFTEILERMGASVITGDDWIECSRARPLGPIDADLNHIPDAAMTLAVLALFADSPSTLRNIASWRVKETDRIAAMATELRKVGATVEEGTDFLRVAPPAGGLVPNATIDTYDDHRMAMCFSLVALGGVPVRINDPGCVAKTFPGYFDAFLSVARA
jgi:3-phosphoshikimate 1-carboxyvinyltransferase